MIDVYLEIGSKRVFACAIDWPGWSRSGRDEHQAIETLLAYAPRYARVVKQAGLKFPAATEARVVERIPGSATTDFGAPGELPSAAAEKMTPAAAKRMTALVQAAWDVLDEVVAGAPAELRKGPRGGGRDRDKIVAHVVDAEDAYARKIGARVKTDQRPALLEAINRGQTGERGWTARQAARRIAWHALDHAWEIEDRS